MSSEASGTVTMDQLKNAAEDTEGDIKDSAGDIDSNDDGNAADNKADTSGDEGSKSDTSEDIMAQKIAAEKELQAVKSNLGRKLAAMEANQQELMDKIDSLTYPNSSDNDEDDDFEIPTTREEFNAAFEAAKARDLKAAQEKQTRYQKGYLEAVDKLAGEDPVYHEEVYKEMMANFNVKLSDNPALDAEVNYSKAEAAVLRNKFGVKKSPLKGNTEYTNTQSPQKMVQKKSSKPTKLTGIEEEYAKMMGMTEEQISKAMGSEIPTYQMK